MYQGFIGLWFMRSVLSFVVLAGFLVSAYAQGETPNQLCLSHGGVHAETLEPPAVRAGELADAVRFATYILQPGSWVSLDVANNGGEDFDSVLGVFNSGCELIDYNDDGVGLGFYSRIPRVRVPDDGVLNVAVTLYPDLEFDGLSDDQLTGLTHDYVLTISPINSAMLAELVACDVSLADGGRCRLSVTLENLSQTHTFEGRVWASVIGYLSAPDYLITNFSTRKPEVALLPGESKTYRMGFPVPAAAAEAVCIEIFLGQNPGALFNPVDLGDGRFFCINTEQGEIDL